MKRVIISILMIVILGLLFNTIFRFRAIRSEETVHIHALSNITEWQSKLRSDIPFDYASFSKIFNSEDVLSEINLYEERVCRHYNILHQNNLSAVGILMQLQKNNFLLSINPQRFYPVTGFTKEKRDWHWLYGVLIPTSKDKMENYAFIRLGYDCKMKITESYIGQNSFISLLGINPDTGEILDKKLERIFIEKMTHF